jgi:hypothetical protein
LFEELRKRHPIEVPERFQQLPLPLRVADRLEVLVDVLRREGPVLRVVFSYGKRERPPQRLAGLRQHALPHHVRDRRQRRGMDRVRGQVEQLEVLLHTRV